jgi:hypothetical protein
MVDSIDTIRIGASSPVPLYDMSDRERADLVSLFGRRLPRNQTGSFRIRTRDSKIYKEAERVALLVPKYQEIFKDALPKRKDSETAPPTLFDKSATYSAVAIDIVSATRNTLNASSAAATAEVAGKMAKGVGVLAIVGGAMGVYSGGALVKIGAKRTYTAIKRGDVEGAALGVGFGLMGASYGTVSGAMVVSSAATFAKAGAVAASSTLVLAGAGFAMYGVIGVYSAYELGVTLKFKSKLNDRLKLEYGSHKALRWMRDQVRGGNEAELQKKWDVFARRTSPAACRLVRETVTPELLRKVRLGDKEALKKADFIIKEVAKATNKQIIKNCVLLAIVVIGILAFVGMMVLAGPAVPALFALGALLWLYIDSPEIQEALSNRFCGKSEI